jgi:hypothetical protein
MPVQTRAMLKKQLNSQKETQTIQDNTTSECLICYYELKEDICNIKCKHNYFHNKCLQKIVNDQCPLCREKMGINLTPIEPISTSRREIVLTIDDLRTIRVPVILPSSQQSVNVICEIRIRNQEVEEYYGEEIVIQVTERVTEINSRNCCIIM